MYQPVGTLGTLIRAPKQQYFIPEQTSFYGPLSERVKTSDSLSKLPNKLFYSRPTSLLARGHVSASKDPCDPHQSPQTIFTLRTMRVYY